MRLQTPPLHRLTRHIRSAAHTFEQQLYEATRLWHQDQCRRGRMSEVLSRGEFFGRGLLFPTFNAGITDLERFSQAYSGPLLMIGVTCSPFRAKAAHFSGHLPHGSPGENPDTRLKDRY
jgi:hypothetical protein